MKTVHLVITRLAIKWFQKPGGLDWNTWLDNSIELMDKYCRPSLRQQTDQNFILISLVDNSVIKIGKMLNNECIMPVESTMHKIPDMINQYVSAKDYDSYIITRLDRDDCLRKDFIANVKKYFIDGKEKYIDIRNCHTYDTKTGLTYKSLRYQNNYVSPFVSTFEKVRNNRIDCWPYAVQHHEVSENIPGEKVNDLYTLQVIHDHNISNVIDGEEEKVKLKDYF